MLLIKFICKTLKATPLIFIFKILIYIFSLANCAIIFVNFLPCDVTF